MNEPPEEQIRQIRELLEKIQPDDEHVKRVRYEHGGGRMFRAVPDDKPGGEARSLILDVYEEGDREFYFHAAEMVRTLLAHLAAVQQERDEAREAARRRGCIFRSKAIEDSLRAIGLAADASEAAMVEAVKRVGAQKQQAEAQLAALTASQGWQPIETAPKDGTFFIGFDGKGGVGKAHWCERYNPHAWADEDGMFVHPTHWMPLPLSPVLASSDGHKE